MNETVKYLVKWAVILILGVTGLSVVGIVVIMLMGYKLMLG